MNSQSGLIETGHAFLGDYDVSFRRISDHQTITRINLGEENAASIETYKHFVRVNVAPKNMDAFNGSAGMLGSYPAGQMVGRDGKTIIEDPNSFGQEWMVRPSDPIIFHDVESIADYPINCPMPNLEAKEDARRRLGEIISKEEAATACAHVSLADRNFCIFDVLATNTKDVVGTYH